MSLKNYDAHAALVAAAAEMRARAVSDARMLVAAGRARRALEARDVRMNRARGALALLAAVLAVAVAL